jgi:internalin A
MDSSKLKHSSQISNDRLMKSILFLTANPKNTVNLRLQEEEREIKERLRLAGYGKVPINSVSAVRPRDIQQALLDFKPQVVHFSGHGANQQGLVFEDKLGKAKLINAEALAQLFELFANKVECVILNACYSATQAQAIARHIQYVVGMNDAIGDSAAIEFSVGFYAALGNGENFEFAYRMGCVAVRLEGIQEHLTPEFLKREFQTSNSRSPFNVETYPEEGYWSSKFR